MADDVRRLRVEIVGAREAEQTLDRLIAKRNQLFAGGSGSGGGGGGRITAIGDPGSSVPVGPGGIQRAGASVAGDAGLGTLAAAGAALASRRIATLESGMLRALQAARGDEAFSRRVQRALPARRDVIDVAGRVLPDGGGGGRGGPPRALGPGVEFVDGRFPPRRGGFDGGGGGPGGGGGAGSSLGAQPPGALDRFGRAAFPAAIAGLTFTFGLAPLFQANDAALQANRAFGPRNPERAQLTLDRQDALARLGSQADQAQQAFDRLGNRLLRFAADANLGGALNVGSNAGRGAAAGLNLFSVAAGVGGVLGAGGLAAVGARSAFTGGSGAVAGGGGLLAGAGALAGGALRATGPLALAGATVGGLGLATPRAAQMAEQSGDDFLRSATRVARDVVRSVPLLGNQLASFLQATAPAVDADGNRIVPTGATAPTVFPDVRAASALRPARLGFDASRILGRQTEEGRLAEADPRGVAAQQELLQRREALIGLEGQRAGLALQRRALATDERRAAEDATLARERLGRQAQQQQEDIGISADRARRDLRVRVADSREDVGRNLGRGFRELDISTAQGREDVERGTAESVQDLFLGQIGGLGGGLLRIGVNRQRALESLERNRARQRGALTRGAGDQFGDIDLNARRGLGAIDRGEADQALDAARSFARGWDELAITQKLEATRRQENAGLLNTALAEQERQVARLTALVTNLGTTVDGLVAEAERELKARQDHTRAISDSASDTQAARRRWSSQPY